MITILPFSQESQSLWNRIATSSSVGFPFLTYAWQETWFRTLGNVDESYLLSVDNSIIAPLVRKDSSVFFSGGEEIADYLDLIGPYDQFDQAWKQILSFLKNQKVTSLTFRNIPANSPTIKFFQDLTSETQGLGSIEQEDTTPLISLPKTWEEYLANLDRKDRHELERKVRKFERENPNCRIQLSADPDNDLAILLELMQLDPKKRIFLTPPMITFFRKIPKIFPTQIRLLLVYVQDTVIASTLSFISGKTLLLYNSGFNENFRGAGFYLKAKGIEDAIGQEYQRYNFLQGNERYKYELGGKDFFVYRVSLDLRKFSG